MVYKIKIVNQSQIKKSGELVQLCPKGSQSFCPCLYYALCQLSILSCKFLVRKWLTQTCTHLFQRQKERRQDTCWSYIFNRKGSVSHKLSADMYVSLAQSLMPGVSELQKKICKGPTFQCILGIDFIQKGRRMKGNSCGQANNFCQKRICT